jgi:hypothetical protein
VALHIYAIIPSEEANTHIAAVRFLLANLGGIASWKCISNNLLLYVLVEVYLLPTKLRVLTNNIRADFCVNQQLLSFNGKPKDVTAFDHLCKFTFY